MSVADDAGARVFAGWTPTKPPPTHREFCPRTRLPGGPLKGTPYDPATDPVQSWLIDQIDSGRWQRIYWSAPPQIAGKTQCAIIVPAMRAAICLKAAVGYGLPTLHDLDRGWQTKVAPTIKDAGLGDYLPQQGPGSRGGRPPSVTFEDPENNRAPLGSFVFLAGGAKQVTVRVVVVDEIDAWRSSDGEPRWNDLEDVWSRADSFQSDAIRIGVGTVEVDDPARSIVLALVNEHGTGHRLWARCPHCGTYAAMDWEKFTYEYRTLESGSGADTAHAIATASYACAHCAACWSEDDRRAALLACRFAAKAQTVDAAGIVQGPEPTTRALGLRTHALDCILTTMAAIAEKHALARYALETHANHEPMRKFYRYQRVEGYTGDIDGEADKHKTLDHRDLAARSARTAWTTVVDDRDDHGRWSRNWALELPPASFAVAAIDVQRNRLYTSATGFADDRQTWDLAWGIESAQGGTREAEPPPFVAGELEATLNRTADWYEERLGDLFRIGVVDTGDTDADCIAELIEWLATRPRWVGVRGTGRKGSNSVAGDPGLPKVTGAGQRTDYDAEVDGLICWERRWKPGLGRYIVATTAASRSYLSAYRATPGQPGAAHIPGPLKPGNAYLRHLTARGDVANKVTGVIKFQDIAGRHDWGDCKAYAHAVGMAILTNGRDRVNLDGPDEPTSPGPASTPRGGYLAGFGIGRI